MTTPEPRPDVAQWIQHHLGAELAPEPWQVRAVERIAPGDFDARTMGVRPRGFHGAEHAAAWGEFLHTLDIPDEWNGQGYITKDRDGIVVDGETARGEVEGSGP